MLDLSPEKLLVLLTLGVIVLGPQRLPLAARGLAQGLVKARRLASVLTDPLQATFAEPRRALEETLAGVRSAIGDPLQVAPAPAAQTPAAPDPAAPTPAGQASSVAAGSPSDPSFN